MGIRHGKKIDQTSKKQTILGDRKEHPRKKHATVLVHESAFRVLHACVIDTLVREINTTNHHKAARPTVTTKEQLYAKVRNTLHTTVKALDQKMRGEMDQWKFTED
jgi:hypothetical protein